MNRSVRSVATAAAAAVALGIGGIAFASPATAATAAPAARGAVCTTYKSVPLKSDTSETARIPKSATSYSCTLAWGNTGGGVWSLQNHLNKCYGTTLTVDGVFGAATDQALTMVQIYNLGITGDGVYGPQTRNAMNLFASNMTCNRITKYVGF